MAKGREHFYWIPAGEAVVFLNSPGGAGARLDPDEARKYASQLVAEVSRELAESPFRETVRIGWWSWRPGCIQVTLGFVVLGTAAASSGEIAPVAGAAAAVAGVATVAFAFFKDYEQVKKGVCRCREDVERKWIGIKAWVKRIAAKLPRPRGVDIPPLVVRESSATEKIVEVKQGRNQFIRDELFTYLQGHPEREEVVRQFLIEKGLDPGQSVIVFTLNSDSDDQVLESIYEYTCRSLDRPQ